MTSDPSADEMRSIVAKMYAGPLWKRQVAGMPSNQVVAIFKRESTKREKAEAKARADKRRAARQQ